MKNKKIVCFGPGPQFKGGIANFNTSLAKTFHKLGHIVSIVSWSQQYPSIIPREFVDKTNKINFLEDTSISTEYCLNYNNPLTWKTTAQNILAHQPDIVIIQWSISLQGLPLYFLVKELRKYSNVRLIFDLHFVYQKEASKIDRLFSKPFLELGNEFITHSHKTTKELLNFFPKKKFSLSKTEETKLRIFELYHPIYDIFNPKKDFDIEQFKQKNGLKKHVFLFFGFIRKYKGLHNTIRAFQQLEQQRDDVSLLICGESFWNTLDEKKLSTKLKKVIFGTIKSILLPKNKDEHYQPLSLIDELNVKNVKVFNEYIPNQDVHKYFQASDATVLFYDNSSPSGVESLSYNFSKPIIATNVGHFTETILNGQNGYLAEAHNIKSMVDTMNRLIEQPISKQSVDHYAKQISWKNYAETILCG